MEQNRKQLVKEATELLDLYCEGCLIKATFRKEHGKKYAERFCIRQCTVGQKLKTIGNTLLR